MKAIPISYKEKPDILDDAMKRDIKEMFGGTSMKGNEDLYSNTLLMFTLLFVGMVGMYYMDNPTFFETAVWALITCTGVVGLGLATMHDANHKAYSEKKWVNNVLGRVLDFILGYTPNWKIRHNVLHHTHTGVNSRDADLSTGGFLLRFAKEQKWRRHHRWQKFYAPFLYSVSTLRWFFVNDWRFIPKHHKETQGKHFAIFSFVYLFRLAFWVVLPIIFWGFWDFLIFFLVLHLVCGLCVSYVFQCAHVVEFVDTYTTDEYTQGSRSKHQIEATCNFGTKNKLLTWYIGGLNYQIEHHLFPDIAHVHYPKISEIVRKRCKEFGVRYSELPTFTEALLAHQRHLDYLGKVA